MKAKGVSRRIKIQLIGCRIMKYLFMACAIIFWILSVPCYIYELKHFGTCAILSLVCSSTAFILKKIEKMRDDITTCLTYREWDDPSV